MSVENTHFGPEAIACAMRSADSIFFIGIGGISMAALAELSVAKGLRVGGSDRHTSALTDRLQKKGVCVFEGHRKDRVADYDAVVYTVAIGEDNPEYLEAKRLKKPLFSRADYLGYLMTEFERRIGISGMHGKTTCTAMCADILLAAADPTVMCGAQLASLDGSPCRIGKARSHFLFEACEYMDSFLDFNPSLAVILNIGLDHVDYFHSMEQIRASFLRFAERTASASDGCVLYNADDAETVKALEPFGGKKIGFSVDGNATLCARNVVQDGGRISFDFCREGSVLTRLELQSTGRHNVYNALAAASAAYLCGISTDAIQKGLAAFRGAGRRMERKGTLPCGAVVYDDYGHHPDEIKATLAGAREMGFSRVLCAYQPHTYSRTAGLLEEFSRAFSDADRVYLADVYAAREENVYGVTSEDLAARIGEKAAYCGSLERLSEALLHDARNGDLVIVMGAGDIYKTFSLLGLSSRGED
ncbi:MAG: UDP-N-acetylmuramate--L-alanine ligase [Ruminococcaceae bacterium]|nr:UDP-N-acetylmuramate--L-alanine ligase [Oscillospiraceae bacterium]